MANRKSNNIPIQGNGKLPVMKDKEIAQLRQSIIDMMKESRFADGASVPTLTLYEMSETKYEQMKQNGYVFAMFLEDCPWKTLKTEGFAYDILRLVKEGWLTIDNVVGYLPIPLSVQRWNYLIQKHGQEQMGGVTFSVGKLTFPLYQRELTNIIQKLANKPLLCCTAESSVESGIDDLSKVDDLVVVPFEFLLTHVSSSPVVAAAASAANAIRNSQSFSQPLSLSNIKTQSIGQPPAQTTNGSPIKTSTTVSPVTTNSGAVANGGLATNGSAVTNGIGVVNNNNNNLTPTSPKSLSNLFAVPMVKPTSSPVVTIQPILQTSNQNVPTTSATSNNNLATNLVQLSKRSGLDGQTSPVVSPLPLATVGSTSLGNLTSSVKPTSSIVPNPSVLPTSSVKPTSLVKPTSFTNANGTKEQISPIGVLNTVAPQSTALKSNNVGLVVDNIKIPSLATGGDALIRLEADTVQAVSKPTTTSDSRIVEEIDANLGDDRFSESINKVSFVDNAEHTDRVGITDRIGSNDKVGISDGVGFADKVSFVDISAPAPATVPPSDGQKETNDGNVTMKCGTETLSNGYETVEETIPTVEISKALVPYRPLTFQNLSDSSTEKNHDNNEDSSKLSLLQTQLDNKLNADADWVIRQVENDLQLLEIDPSDPLYEMLKSDQVRQWILENLRQPEGNSLGSERGSGKSRVHVQSVLLSDALDRLFSSTQQNDTF